jgi:hypothetical protein
MLSAMSSSPALLPEFDKIGGLNLSNYARCTVTGCSWQLEEQVEAKVGLERACLHRHLIHLDNFAQVIARKGLVRMLSVMGEIPGMATVSLSKITMEVDVKCTKQLAELIGHKVHEVPGDGSCMYTALLCAHMRREYKRLTESDCYQFLQSMFRNTKEQLQQQLRLGMGNGGFGLITHSSLPSLVSKGVDAEQAQIIRDVIKDIPRDPEHYNWNSKTSDMLLFHGAPYALDRPVEVWTFSCGGTFARMRLPVLFDDAKFNDSKRVDLVRRADTEWPVIIAKTCRTPGWEHYDAIVYAAAGDEPKRRAAVTVVTVAHDDDEAAAAEEKSKKRAPTRKATKRAT